jgi:hypothetical protein
MQWFGRYPRVCERTDRILNKTLRKIDMLHRSCCLPLIALHSCGETSCCLAILRVYGPLVSIMVHAYLPPLNRLRAPRKPSCPTHKAHNNRGYTGLLWRSPLQWFRNIRIRKELMVLTHTHAVLLGALGGWYAGVMTSSIKWQTLGKVYKDDFGSLQGILNWMLTWIPRRDCHFP